MKLEEFETDMRS